MADHFVIDGSNLATEGRTEPSLAQLKEAVAAFHAEHPGANATVVVDASFEHRIDPSERKAFEKTQTDGEVVSPPAGAVGRGDGFLLQIADRTGGTVLSNDSFQEFHAEYEWLFEPGRLIGAKPVPGVGWIFSLRRPVRGIVSRKTVQKAKQGGAKEEKKVQKAIAEATASAMAPDAPKRRRRRGGRGRSSGAKAENDKAEPEAVNEPASFLQFVIDHRLGTEVAGTVEAFASHGAFVNVDGVRCYVPLSAMGNPQPTKARDVLAKDETRTFVVQAVDAPRRGIELGLPGFATVAGAPSEETVAAELGTRRSRSKATTGSKPEGAKRVAKKVAATKAAKPAKATKPASKPARERAKKKPATAEPATVVATEPKLTRSEKKVAAKQKRVAEVMETIAAEKAEKATTTARTTKKGRSKPAPAPIEQAPKKPGQRRPAASAKPAKKKPAPKVAAPAKTKKPAPKVAAPEKATKKATKKPATKATKAEKTTKKATTKQATTKQSDRRRKR